ncbi:ParB N-terminal domain-containing protein [Brevibacillus agri]|uniref:ParB N-terminal domain-containing protein n=1 Tax=Brevibacillus agri TaxID=51101 RepID=UPI001EE5E1E8|nr:ParB N-terminal domain-containing protein [Brevibacillus agri]MCG5252566.1 ParB N-terminal domain-containing protein [Brevibacillus agri]
MMLVLLPIERIVVSDRIRKDFGNIEELAQDIKENGLINPPVVTPEHVLIAGERRLRACKHLGWQQIEVRVMTVRDYEHQLRMEISENENRKEFTFSERVDWARRLERIEKEKARKRMETGKAIDPSENFRKGRATEIVADASGFGSGKQYEKAKYIADHADPEIIAQLDADEISIHRAYQETKRKLAEAERRAEESAAEVDRLRSELDDARMQTAEPEVIERIVEKPVEIVKEVVPAEVDAKLRQMAEKERFYRVQLDEERERVRRYEEHIAELRRQLDAFKQSAQYDALSAKAASFVDRQLEITSECNQLAEKIVVLTLEVPEDVPAFVSEMYKKSFRKLAQVCESAYENMTSVRAVPSENIIEIKGEVVYE